MKKFFRKLGLFAVFVASVFAFSCIRVTDSVDEKKPVKVKEILIEPAEFSLGLHRFTLLLAKVLPENATSKAIKWSSSDESVAVVSEYGVVGGLSEGEAIITVASDENPAINATCKITVSKDGGEGDAILVSKIRIKREAEVEGDDGNPVKDYVEVGEDETISLGIERFVRLSATVLPENAMNKSVLWSSSDENVAIVYQDGFVVGKRRGEATIFATAQDGSGVEAACKIAVSARGGGGDFVPIDEILIEPAEFSLGIDKQVKLTGTLLPEYATPVKIRWYSQNPNIATVDSYAGVVTGISAGEVEIEAGFYDENSNFIVKGTCKISVSAEGGGDAFPVKNVELNKEGESLCVDDTLQLSATVLPQNAGNKKVLWSSDKSEIATVDGNGLVTAIAEGDALITATTEDGGKTATCAVSVFAKGVHIGLDWKEAAECVAALGAGESIKLVMKSGLNDLTNAYDFAMQVLDGTKSVSIDFSKTAFEEIPFFSYQGGIPATFNTLKPLSIVEVLLPAALKSFNPPITNLWSTLENINAPEDSQNFKSIDGVLLSKNGETLVRYPPGKKSATYTIPDCVRRLGYLAFSWVEFLETLTIPDSVTDINGGTVFYYPKKLKTLTIGNGVKNISDGAFMSWVLERVDVSAGNPNFMSIDGVVFTKDGKELVYYGPKIPYENYAIPNGVIQIRNYAFDMNNTIKTITIPASLEYFGYRWIGSCSNYTSIIADEANPYYKSIDGVLFSKDGKRIVTFPCAKGGTYEKTYEIPNGVTDIGACAFYTCRTATCPTTVTIPASVINIGYLAFSATILNINFLGTKVQWNAIGKHAGWSERLRYAPLTIHCTDGDVQGTGGLLLMSSRMSLSANFDNFDAEGECEPCAPSLR